MGETAETIDEVYTERAHLVAYLASILHSHCEPPTEDGYRYVYVETAAGQLSWQINPRDWHLFEGVHWCPDAQKWDGHSTPTKYNRLDQLTKWANENRDENLTKASAEFDQHRGSGATIHEASNVEV